MFRIGSIVLMLGWGVIAAQEIPLVGRPTTDFYGAIGDQVLITTSATPTSLTVEDTIAFTLTVEGVRNARELPRPDLRQIPEFAQRFAIEDGPMRIVSQQSTAFEYRLRPRASDLQEIPEVVYRYFSPRRQSQLNNPTQWFPTTSTDPIPLMMRKVEVAPPARVPLLIPEFAERIDTTSTNGPNYLIFGFVIGLPPLLGWLLRSRHPRPIAHRESVRRILHALERVSADPAQGAREAATLLERYVRETNQQMLIYECEVAELLRACDAVRFGGAMMNPAPPVQIMEAIERWERERVTSSSG